MGDKRQRILWILVLTCLMSLLILAQLFHVQVLSSESYANDSLNNRLQEVSVTPNRGIIYDSKDEALAVSVETTSVYITPSVIRDSKERKTIVSDIAKSLGMTEKAVNKIVDDSTGDFAWVKRQVDSEKAEKLQEKDYLGIGFTTEYKRTYPNDRLLSQTLGFVGIDNQGLAGVELQYDDLLGGTAGKLVVEYDKYGNAIPQSVRESIPATQGKNVYLTIDSTIQYYVEKALASAQEVQNAKAMTCIVMDVKNGNILAMANTPNFDPNSYDKYEAELWSNLAISKLYEPGSPFKSLSTSMYLEEDIAEPDTQVFCAGYIDIDGNRFQDWDYPDEDGAETLKHALEQSCNVAQEIFVQKLGKDRFYNYLDGFGMTRKTGVDLPSESSPLLIEKDQAVPIDLAVEAIGQGNAYTALQMITAFSAVVNGGHLMKPQILSKVTDADGDVISETQPEEVRRVISDETSAQMRDMLEGVVLEGLGTPAAVEGYRVGGKTGTAEIAEGGTYGENNYILSFMGFAPVDDPKFACLVIVDSPESGGNSGTLAGGIFSEITGNILSYMQVPQTEDISAENENVTTANEGDYVTVPDLSLPMDIEEARAAMAQAGLQVSDVTSGSKLVSYLPVAGTKVSAGSTIEFYAMDEGSDSFIMPDLTGKTIKDVDIVLSSFGMKVQINGSGLAYRQQPEGGTSVSKGGQAKMWFASNANRASIEAAAEKLQQEDEQKSSVKTTKDSSDTEN